MLYKAIRIAIGVAGLATATVAVITFNHLMDLSDLGAAVSGHGIYTFAWRIAGGIFILILAFTNWNLNDPIGSSRRSESRWSVIVSWLPDAALLLAALALIAAVGLDLFLEYRQAPFEPAFNRAMIPLQLVSGTAAVFAAMPAVIRLRR